MHSGVQHILSFRFVFLHFECPMLPASLDYPFLIAPSVFCNVYLLVPESEWISKPVLASVIYQVLASVIYLVGPLLICCLSPQCIGS